MTIAYGRTISAAAPTEAGTTAAATGILRPRSTGTHRGQTSPHTATSPTARNASPSLTTLSETMYHHGPFSRAVAAARACGSVSSSGMPPISAAILQRADGSAVSAVA